ncbi:MULTISPECIES: imidazolonepropionase [unclassified Polaromonas]|uniref:imidazolonepropionase n=1 Tax=unclassified Polaromonas TaxID=2638319 RepID=UPI000F07A6B6|nr:MULTISPECIES: imidazolonepropionase [unclassified Polaromonas]AYQ26984.1 imidazolonepropionase [Polaromonas sp. SP1]QGJ18171.1 imidazolonepropionase [Polaromonas sp. Pch-P]
MSLQLWSHCRAATLQAGAAQPYGLVEDAALVVEGESIAWVGPRADVPADLLARCKTQHDAGGALITPGLIDCHTHLVYGGDRAHEFELRLNGATYEEIARAGGGIASTVKATRSATAHQLQAQSAARLQRLMAEGVTTLEIKSGYGLALAHERKTLSVALALGQTYAVDIRTTFLGAHAVPAEFAGRTDAYVDAVLEMLPVLHAEGLVDAVDAFCERIAFSTAQTERVFAAAKALGIPVKLHAEQLSDSGGAQLAARYGALSCDHLEWLSAEGAQAMAAAGSVAVLLPGAFYFLRETKLPPMALLREHGVPMAISTDCNPGSSPCTSLLLMLNMACTLFRLTPEEALAGITRHAAAALGLHDRGVLAAGMRADFVLWGVERPAALSYAFGANPRLQTVFKGQIT